MKKELHIWIDHINKQLEIQGKLLLEIIKLLNKKGGEKK